MKSDHSERFTPAQRVKKRAQFLRIQSSGRKLRSPHFLFIFEPRREPQSTKESTPLNRLGVTITTKINKRSVQRNLLRRRIREIFRREFPYGILDIVVVALNGATELTFDEVRDELRSLAIKARILRENSE